MNYVRFPLTEHDYRNQPYCIICLVIQRNQKQTNVNSLWRSQTKHVLMSRYCLQELNFLSKSSVEECILTIYHSILKAGSTTTHSSLVTFSGTKYFAIINRGRCQYLCNFVYIFLGWYSYYVREQVEVVGNRSSTKRSCKSIFFSKVKEKR